MNNENVTNEQLLEVFKILMGSWLYMGTNDHEEDRVSAKKEMVALLQVHIGNQTIEDYVSDLLNIEI